MDQPPVGDEVAVMRKVATCLFFFGVGVAVGAIGLLTDIMRREPNPVWPGKPRTSRWSM